MRILASGGINLFDMLQGVINAGVDSGQNLEDQDITDLATKFFILHPNIKNFDLAVIKVGYVDGASTNHFTELILLEGPHATDQIQQSKYIWSSKEEASPIIETPVASGSEHLYILNPPRPVALDVAGRLYFITTWGTIIAAGAAEWLNMQIYGYINTGSK